MTRSSAGRRHRRDPRVLILVLCVLIMHGDIPNAADDETPAGQTRPSIGLVLAGGGARGAAHIGVLKVLEELRVPVDYIAGTSMGSIVGGMYAVGYSPEQMEEILGRIDWHTVFRDLPDRRQISFRSKVDDRIPLFPFEFGIGKKGLTTKGGIVTAVQIETVFQAATLDTAGIEHFDQLRIPYRAVAADLRTGEAVVLDHGNLAEAMRASMSIPGAFTPVEIEGRILVDGGIANNMPVDVARGMGAGRILAIDVGTPPKSSVKGLSSAGIIGQTLSVTTEQNVIAQRASLGAGDLLITPELEGIGAGSFDKLKTAIDAGEAAARLRMDELRAFSVSEEEYAAFQKRQRRETEGLLPQVIIDEIVVEGIPDLDPKILTRQMETKPGKPLELAALRRDLVRIHRAGTFMKVGFRLEKVEDRNRLVVQAYPKSWGPGYLRVGLTLETDLAGDSEFSILGYYRRANVNRLGAEWKNVIRLGSPTALFSEFYQPLHPRGMWFAAPVVAIEKRQDDVVLPDGTFESWERTWSQGSFDLGVNLFHYASMRLGVLAGDVRLEPHTDSTFSKEKFDTGGFHYQLELDQIDNVVFPTSGNHTRLEVFFSREAMGADVEYERAIVNSLQAFTFRRNTFVAWVWGGTDFGSGLPIYDQFELGGFMKLSGYKQGFFRGNAMGLVSLADYVRIGDLPAGLGRLYAGLAVQSGATWPDASDADFSDFKYSGTLFFGVDNRIAAVFVGYGQGEGGEHQVYVFVGYPFQASGVGR